MAQGAQTTYTLPEYNALQAAQAEKDMAARIKELDDFVAKFPASTLMQYIYQLYYQTYYQMKNYPKAVEYTDKLLALGDKADLPIRVSGDSSSRAIIPAGVSMPRQPTARPTDENRSERERRHDGRQDFCLTSRRPSPM